MSEEALSYVLAMAFLLLLGAWVPVLDMLRRAVNRARVDERAASDPES